MQCDQVYEYVIEAKERNLQLMHLSDEAYNFYFYQGKFMAFSEIQREIEEQCK